MDNLLKQGDLVSDQNGGVVTVTGLAELIQCALLRLTMKQGSFPYQPQLGSTLSSLDGNRLDRQYLYMAVEGALAGMTEVQVQDVEYELDEQEETLYLTVFLKISGQDAVVEWQSYLS